MFGQADAHIAVCDPEGLPGPEPVIRVSDRARVIVKALHEGEHHALLLQVRLRDNARAEKPGVWPAAAHPANLEIQLAVPTTVYHWLQAFHDLRWRGKPDGQIGATHWQEWLQADAQRDTVRGLGPARVTRDLEVLALGRALAPHTVPLTNLLFDPAPQGAIRKSVPLRAARGATEPTKCPLCTDKCYTSGAMLEHLAWHVVHAAAPAEDKEATSHILQVPARRATWHAPYAQRPPSRGQPRGGPRGGGGGGRSGPESRRCSPPGVQPLGLGPLWAPLGAGSTPHGPGTPQGPGCPSNPAAMPVRNS